MRILTINYEYPPIGGGGGFVTRDIFENMAEMGHDITVITSHYDGLAKRETVNGVNIVRVPVCLRKNMEVANMPSMLSYLPSSIINVIIHLNHYKKYDIINTHFAIPSGPSGYFLSKLLNIPNVLSIHGGDIYDPSKSLSPHNTPLLRQTVRFMLNNADHIVAQSSDTRSNAYRYYNISRPVEIIPLGIKKPIFKTKKRMDFDLNDDDFIFCSIGRLIKRKNIDESLMILDELKKEHDFKMLIMGDGPEFNHIQRLVDQFGLHEHVRLLGNVSDEMKFQVLDLSDCYFSTALHEGFGLVFLEAMECGLPIISYNHGGHKDFLINNKTGYLVELGDKTSFMEKLGYLIENSTLRNKMSLFNKSLIDDYYINKCAEKYISLFENAVSKSYGLKRFH